MKYNNLISLGSSYLNETICKVSRGEVPSAALNNMGMRRQEAWLVWLWLRWDKCPHNSPKCVCVCERERWRDHVQAGVAPWEPPQPQTVINKPFFSPLQCRLSSRQKPIGIHYIEQHPDFSWTVGLTVSWQWPIERWDTVFSVQYSSRRMEGDRDS